MYIMNIIYFLCILYIHLFYKHYIHLWMHVNSMNNSERPLCCSVCVFVRWLPAWQTQALWASEKQLTAWWDHLSASLVQRMVFLNACPCVIWLQGFSCTWRFWRACRTICRHPSNLVALGLLRCVSRDLEKKTSMRWSWWFRILESKGMVRRHLAKFGGISMLQLLKTAMATCFSLNLEQEGIP